MTYFVRSRKALGWSDGRLLWHFFVRGSVLVALNLIQSIGMSGGFGEGPNSTCLSMLTKAQQNTKLSMWRSLVRSYCSTCTWGQLFLRGRRSHWVEPYLRYHQAFIEP